MPTPLMEQYASIKAQHPREILLFRLGDFYEMFNEDARTASRVLGIVLTSRAKGDGRIPMAGIPHHSSASYINRLLKAGHRVAVCEQTQDAEEAEGLVDRAVVRVITPGTLVEESILDEKRNNYLAAVAVSKGRAGLAWIDTSTGAFLAEDLEESRLADELVRLSPAETLLESADGPLADRVRAASGGIVTPWEDFHFDPESGARALCEQFGVANLDGFGLRDVRLGLGAAGAVLAYVKETQRGPLAHVVRLEKHAAAGRVFLDRQTQSSLELTEIQRTGDRKGSLLWVLDRTLTPMGARLLRDWITAPLSETATIRRRQDAVAELVAERATRAALQEALKSVCDLERVLAKVGTGRVPPRDLVALRRSLEAMPRLRALRLACADLKSVGLHADLCARLAKALVDDPPNVITEGGLFRPGFDAELDEVSALARDGKAWLVDYEKRESERTKIPSLKVGYNSVFGYYLEITNVHAGKIPAGYVRKQTLKNAERYITPELKEYETKLLNADGRAKELEHRLFTALRDGVAEEIPALQRTARAVAELDALASLAQAAEEYDYVRPEIDESAVLDVRDARHPVLERISAKKFVPNDVVVGEGPSLLLITGPNMAGKSTYIRQAALVALLAQIGSFVPASKARVGVCDRIFTRIGASDDLTRDASTFMVEMNETAAILNNATARSLIVLDEIGRGTSTFDGVSIAWAVCEHLHDKIGARTLFATHYHELTELASIRKGIRNLHVAVREWGDSIVFLHKILEGATDKSYGIHVARLAGIPREVVDRSKVILAQLENLALNDEDRPKIAASKRRQGDLAQMSLFAPKAPPPAADPFRDELAKIEIDHLTPLQALARLAELKEKAKKPRA
jgi:DNA mismatch repair protein MutS